MDENGTKKLREEMLTILRTSDELVRTFKRQIEGKNVIMFIGNTRSGKSTLINYVTGQPLVAFQNGNHFKIELQNSRIKVATIGHGSLSHTTVPNVIEMQGQPDTLIVDAPGFDDNRGPLQEIRNALYINQIKYAKGVRFVLVVDSNNIVADNINYFLSFIETVEAILPDFTKLQEAVSVVFTKDWREYAKSEMADLLKTKILDVHGMRVNKDLVRHFVERDDLIGLFKMPTAVGPLTEEDVDDNIRNAIFDSSPINLNESDIKFGLSKSASVFLLGTYMEFHDIVITLQSVFETFVNVSLEKFACLKGDNLFCLTSEQLEGQPNNVTLILNRFCSIVVDFKEEVVSTSQIPSVSRALFEELNNVCRELTEIGVDVPDVLYPETLSLEDIRNKLEYISCIEKIVEIDYKSRNILDSYRKNIAGMSTELLELLCKVYIEIAVREDLRKHMSAVIDIEPCLERVNNLYLFASSVKELLKMKSQLHSYVYIIEQLITNINKRPVLKNLVAKHIDEASRTRGRVLSKLQEISGLVEVKNNDVLFKSFPTSVECVIGMLVYFTGFAPFRWLNLPYPWSFFAGSCLLVGYTCWRSNSTRRRFSRLHQRYRQKRLFSDRTLLDNYCNKFLKED